MRFTHFRYFFLALFFQLCCLLPCYAQLDTISSVIQKFDINTLINIAKTRTPEKTAVFRFITNTHEIGDIGIPVALLVGGMIRDDQQMRQNALFVATSTALTYGVTALVKVIVKRPRPFIRNVTFVPVYRAEHYSFPSGHTSTTFATASALSMAYPKWYVIAPAYLWAGSIGYSRMYLGVHYPTDVAAGALVGAGTAASMLWLRKP